VLVKAHSPFTTPTPATPPASLMCPSCDRPLAYDRSHIGGVNDRQREQWDTTGAFAALSSIVSAPASSVALTQCLNGQPQKRSNAQSACGYGLC
jgi:hypothetical protein